MSNVREEVKWFSERMEKKLKANDHKGGWDDLSFPELFSLLMNETRELQASIILGMSPYFIIDEAADVANFAMMIADIARKKC